MYKFISIFLLFFYILPITLVTTNELIFESFQVLIILIGFFLGGYIFDNANKRKDPVDYSSYLNVKSSLLLLILICYFAIRFEYIEEIITNIFNGSYTEFALNNAIERYESNTDKGLMHKIGTILFFTYALLLSWVNAKSRILFYFIFLVFIFIESSDLARAGVLLAVTGFFIETLFKNNVFFTRLKMSQYLAISFLFVILLGIIFFYSAYIRVANEEDVAEILLSKLSVYFAAMYEALLLWMSATSEYGSDYGFNTYASIFKIFGTQVNQGFYLFINTTYGETNIYLNLRGLLSDFGFTITALLFMVSGFFIKNATYYKVSVIGYLFVRVLLFHLLFLLISPFVFFTLLAAVVFSWILLIFSSRKFMASIL